MNANQVNRLLDNVAMDTYGNVDSKGFMFAGWIVRARAYNCVHDGMACVYSFRRPNGELGPQIVSRASAFAFLAEGVTP